MKSFSYEATKHFLPTVEKIFSEGAPQTWESYFPATDQVLHMTSVPLGEYFISTGTDITDRKKAENSLKSQKDRFGFILKRNQCRYLGMEYPDRRDHFQRALGGNDRVLIGRDLAYFDRNLDEVFSSGRPASRQQGAFEALQRRNRLL